MAHFLPFTSAMTDAGLALAMEIDASVNAKIWDFLLSGGVFMGFIAVCSFIAFAISIHRLMSLRWRAVLPPVLVDQLERAERTFRQGKAAELFRFLDESDSPVGRIGCVAMLPEHATREEAQDAVEATAREEVVRLQTGLSALEVVITIAPLLGLLGTVSGLVSVFATLGESKDVADPSAIAAGIAKALNTTIGGLAVAVPTVIVHSFLQKRIEALAARMEILIGHLLNAFHRNGGAALYERGEINTAQRDLPMAASDDAPPELDDEIVLGAFDAGEKSRRS
ncbi:MAG: MotA/TolQ/ExbB proton channel family protein [Verrucomicrobiae bacterium]|nr:MotA/TolQ/ExbB proton channel family protein [Verrucomicrobiae bacterium]